MNCSKIMLCTHHDSLAMLLHKRLGHFHHQGIWRMIQNGGVIRLPPIVINNTDCKTFAIGKQTRSRIPREQTSESIEVLQLVHSDICESLCIKSLGGAKYFLTFSDNFSRMTFVYFLHKKSDAFEVFTQLHQEMERQTCKKLLILRTDNGSEFTLQEFKGYCAFHGIRRQLSQSYSPHENGVVGRKNRSLLDTTRCLLLEKNLLKNLWVEAIRAACRIFNIQTSHRNPSKMPLELFSNKKPDISRLKVFGSTAFIITTKPGKGKLDAQSERCYYLNKDENTKGFQCYNPRTKHVFINKDARFMESTINSDISHDEPSIMEPSRHELNYYYLSSSHSP